MMKSKDECADMLDSPLELLYSAWFDQQKTVNQRVTEHYVNLDKLLSSLPERAQHEVYCAIFQVVSEYERLAFLAGLRTGTRLAAEVGV